MYAVSEEYREAMHSKVQTFRLTGTARNKPFTEANILKGSFPECVTQNRSSIA